jgi:hypothetical protein
MTATRLRNWWRCFRTVVLNKVRWYRLGGEVSQRQWGDVLGLLRVQAGALDQDYLRLWAIELGVTDLLDKALVETRGSL